MGVFLKRVFVYFVIINYLHLTLIPSLAVAEYGAWSRWQDNNLKLKVKRKLVPENDEAFQSGIDITLTANSPEQKETLIHTFIPDTAYSKREKGKVNKKPNTLAYQWETKYLSNLQFTIGQDGSLRVTGHNDQLENLTISSDTDIHLENLTVHSLQLKAAKVNLNQQVNLTQANFSLKDEKSVAVIKENAVVSLPYLSLLKGRLKNKGEIQNLSATHLHMEQGTVLDNHGTVGANQFLHFSGNGTINNYGHILTNVLTGKTEKLSNYKTIKANDINLLMMSKFYNEGKIEAENKTHLALLSQDFENTGQIIGNTYKVIAQKTIVNRGKIKGTSGVVHSFNEKIINEGIIESALIEAKQFINTPTGNIIDAFCIKTTQGENNGFLNTENLTLEKKGTFTNRAEMRVKLMKGEGRLYNKGEMIIGSAEAEGQHFYNYKKLQVMETAAFSHFLNKGTATVNHLDVKIKGINQNKLNVTSITGNGTFHNQAKLTFVGNKNASATLQV